MPSFIDVEFIGPDEQVGIMLDRLAYVTSPVVLNQFLNTKIDPYLRMRMESRFQQEGDDVTGPWAPLSPVTEQFRTQFGFGAAHPINIRTGDLHDYIVGTPGMNVYDATGATLVLPGRPPEGKVLKKKLKTAQQGDDRTPARPVLGMNLQDLTVVMGSLHAHITSGLL